MDIRIIEVGELNSYIKNKIETDSRLSSICVRGEISNFKHHYSGHMYLSLKDSASSVRAVMFKGKNSSLKFVPKDGMSVLAIGAIGVYERDGAYQLYIDTMIPDGIGRLYAAYESLKAELSAKGFFDEARKRPIPKYPSVIGVVTASTGAAVRDIINVITRRYPLCDIRIYPARVQGVGASESIVRGIEFLNKHTDADVLIVGRGGGSIEDLWAFNERETAMAVYNSRIPVISAVGHETDFTITDFVADLRAPTPSAAAELATPDISEIRNFLMQGRLRLARALVALTDAKMNSLQVLISSPVMKNPMRLTDERAQYLDDAIRRLKDGYRMCTDNKLEKLRECSYKLEALNPVSVLSRGFSVALKDGRAVRSKKDVMPNDEITLKVSDGDIGCVVKGEV